MFLLDELLQGTNRRSPYRRGRGGPGADRTRRSWLISTHDLALAEIGGLPDGYLHNVHFQDELENGMMRFDYRLREGWSPSNGLELMRSIGLDV